MFGPKGPFCQSCGMPLARNERGGGTEADGTKSQEYCSHCYQHGEFTEPSLTIQEMAAKVQGKLRAMHIPGFLANYFTKDLPNLRRWQAGARN